MWPIAATVVGVCCLYTGGGGDGDCHASVFASRGAPQGFYFFMVPLLWVERGRPGLGWWVRCSGRRWFLARFVDILDVRAFLVAGWVGVW